MKICEKVAIRYTEGKGKFTSVPGPKGDQQRSALSEQIIMDKIVVALLNNGV